jgi:hypothetical protein
VRAGAVVCWLLAAPAAHADGPALAHVTLDGRTLTLTAQNTPFQPPMIRVDGPVLELTFADLHLGFPLPPVLELTLRQADGTWQAGRFRLDIGGVIYMNDDVQITDISGEGVEDLSFSLHLQTLAPRDPLGVRIVPITADVTMRSP